MCPPRPPPTLGLRTWNLGNISLYLLSFPPHASAEACCPLSPTFSESLNSRGWGLDPDLDFVSSRWPCVWGGWWGFNLLIPKASGIGVRGGWGGVPCHPCMHVPNVVKLQMGERPLGSRVPRLHSEEPLEAYFCPVMNHCTLKYLSPAHGPPELRKACPRGNKTPKQATPKSQALQLVSEELWEGPACRQPCGGGDSLTSHSHGGLNASPT